MSPSEEPRTWKPSPVYQYLTSLFESLPPGEVQVYVWLIRCGTTVVSKIRFFCVATFNVLLVQCNPVPSDFLHFVRPLNLTYTSQILVNLSSVTLSYRAPHVKIPNFMYILLCLGPCPRSCVEFHSMLIFLMPGLVSPRRNFQARGTSLISCPRLLILIDISSYFLYTEAVFFIRNLRICYVIVTNTHLRETLCTLRDTEIHLR